MGRRVFCERNLGLVISEEVVSYVSSGICLFAVGRGAGQTT